MSPQLTECSERKLSGRITPPSVEKLSERIFLQFTRRGNEMYVEISKCLYKGYINKHNL